MSTNRTYGVLVVDDDADFRESVQRLLWVAGESLPVRAFEAGRGDEAMSMLKEEDIDCMLLDQRMPGGTGVEWIARFLEADPDLAIVMVTGQGDEQTAAQAMKNGAADYLVKGAIGAESLQRAIANAVEKANLRSAAKKHLDQLQESYRRLSELEQMRDNLTHMIVHDMRNPLFVIGLSLDMLLEELPGRLKEKEVAYLNSINDQTLLLVEMANSLLDVSRFEAGRIPMNIEACDLSGLMRDAVGRLGIMAERHGVSLVAEGESVPISCDESLIRRVITNLMVNGIKFTPRGGEVRALADSEGPVARFELADTGYGIPREHHARIFEKFGQAGLPKEDRTGVSVGLGLTFCKLAVEAHGGTIGVRSEPPKGSTFWFTLPVEQASGSGPSAAATDVRRDQEETT